jgi:hypothetical protein
MQFALNALWKEPHMELVLGIVFAAAAVLVLALAALKVIPLSMKIAQVPASICTGAAVILLFSYFV